MNRQACYISKNSRRFTMSLEGAEGAFSYSERPLNPRDFSSFGAYWVAVHAAEAADGDIAEPSDEVLELQKRAGQLAIEANTEPTRLTGGEHRRVDELQAAAGQAATEANLSILS
jgi:hypothetical protein